MEKTKRAIEVIARGVCVVDGCVLLCHSCGADNTYLPGGHVEFRESARDALEREVREELGLKSRAGKFLGCVEHCFKQRGKWHAEVNLIFALHIPGLTADAAPPAREEWLDFRWCATRRLRTAHLEPAAVIPLISRNICLM